MIFCNVNYSISGELQGKDFPKFHVKNKFCVLIYAMEQFINKVHFKKNLLWYAVPLLKSGVWGQSTFYLICLKKWGV